MFGQTRKKLISKLFWCHFVRKSIRNNVFKIPMNPICGKKWQSFDVYDIFMHSYPLSSITRTNLLYIRKKITWKLSNAQCYNKYNLTLIIPTDHHLEFHI